MKSVKTHCNTNEQWWGIAFIAPQFTGILAFILLPALASLYISFTEWDFINMPRWIGINNYISVLSDPVTWKVLKNTVLFIAGNLPLNLLISLLLALALSSKIKGFAFYRTAFFLPNITSSVAVSLLWQWLYNQDMGLINVALGAIGIQGPGWINDTAWALPSVIIMTVWQGVGYNMVILIAGIKGIPESYYEAAIIDGAGSWTCFQRITLPMLTPTLFFITTMMLIGGFQVFNEAYMLTRGGPADATNVIVLQIYNYAFQFFKMGPAAVLSWMLFIIILLVTLLQFKYSKKWVNYDV